MERPKVYNRNLCVFFWLFSFYFLLQCEPFIPKHPLPHSPCPTMFLEKPRTNPTQGPSGASVFLASINVLSHTWKGRVRQDEVSLVGMHNFNKKCHKTLRV